MKLRIKYANTALNLLIALGISLVINFSYLMLLMIDSKTEDFKAGSIRNEKISSGILSVSPDGHGYLLLSSSDSAYVSQHKIYRLGLLHGDTITAKIHPPTQHRQHAIMGYIKSVNGKKFDYRAVLRQPTNGLNVCLQILFYMAMSLLLITLLTSGKENYTLRKFLIRTLGCVILGIGMYFLAPVTEWRSGRTELNFMNRHMFDYMLILKCTFAVTVSVLYGWVHMLISQRQAMITENEQLKNENLTTRYNMLVGQVNPHFFFNSLNSLAMLIREKDEQKALNYIEQLSYTFRYTLQNGQSMLIPLSEELKFSEAYSYLYKIRYADKLFFETHIDAQYRDWLLPSMTLQPLIGNAVKHNTITKQHPLRVHISVKEGVLEVRNPKSPKIEPEPSTGIGLENLSNRLHLLTGMTLEITDTDTEFIVRIPLQKPSSCSKSSL